MEKPIPNIDKLDAIMDILRAHAAKGERIGYGAVAKRVHMFPRGPWKRLLDHIARTEHDAGRPDITMILYGKDTGYPHQIGFEDARPLKPEQKAYADRAVEAVFAYYAAEPGEKAVTPAQALAECPPARPPRRVRPPRRG